MSSICSFPLRPDFFRSATTSSTKCAYSGFCVAAYTRLGFVVASCGLNSFIDSKSAVSATTFVNFFSCSSWFSLVPVFFSSAIAVLIISSPPCYGLRLNFDRTPLVVSAQSQFQMGAAVIATVCPKGAADHQESSRGAVDSRAHTDRQAQHCLHRCELRDD